MIDLQGDELLTPAELASRIPVVGGRKVTGRQVTRWANRGVGGARLEHVRIGQSIVTTWKAFEAFIRARSASPGGVVPDAGPPGRPEDRHLEAAGNA